MADELYKLVVARMVSQASTQQLEELEKKWGIALELISLEIKERRAAGTRSEPEAESNIQLEDIEEVIREPASPSASIKI